MPAAYKKWVIAFFAMFLAVLALLGSFTAVVDPYFHYHAPLEGLAYDIFYQRYQNDGIVKHFDYDAVITGSSMTENFKTSLCDELFGVNTVKVPFSGAGLKELDMNLRAAFESGNDIKMVIMGLDYGEFIRDKDYMAYDDEDYPKFLYDKNPINDVKYLFNKSIFKTSLDVLLRTRAGLETTSFDEYCAWEPGISYGREAVFFLYERHWMEDEIFHLDEERKALLHGNISQNILETVQAHPETEFYFYFPPYSVLFWDKQYRMGVLELQLDAEMEVVEMLLPHENVHLFSFMDDFELAEDFDRFKDYIHHDPQVNDMILECMASGEHRLTAENYQAYHEKLYDYYTNYDFDALFE